MSERGSDDDVRCAACGADVPAGNAGLHALFCSGAGRRRGGGALEPARDDEPSAPPAEPAGPRHHLAELADAAGAPPDAAVNARREWACRSCTYANDEGAAPLRCGMCGVARDGAGDAKREEADEDDGWEPVERPPRELPGARGEVLLPGAGAERKEAERKEEEEAEAGPPCDGGERGPAGWAVSGAVSGGLFGAVIGGLYGWLSGSGVASGAAEGVLRGGVAGALLSASSQQHLEQERRRRRHGAGAQGLARGMARARIAMEAGSQPVVMSVRGTRMLVVRGQDGVLRGVPLGRDGSGGREPEADDYARLLEQFGDGSENRNDGLTDEQVGEMPERALTAAEVARLPDSAKSCSVCLDEFEAGSSVRWLPCMHCYHRDCIDKWLREKAMCPLCKHSLLPGEA